MKKTYSLMEFEWDRNKKTYLLLAFALFSIAGTAFLAGENAEATDIPVQVCPECRCINSCPVCPIEKEIKYITQIGPLETIANTQKDADSCIIGSRAIKDLLNDAGYPNSIAFVKVRGHDEGHVINTVIIYIDKSMGILSPKEMQDYQIIKRLSKEEYEADELTMKGYYADKWKRGFDE